MNALAKHTQKRTGNSILRACLVGISLLLQIGWLLLVILELNHYSTYISLLSGILAALIVVGLYSKNTNSAFKLPWIMLIMALPVMGLSLYLMTQILGKSPYTRKKLATIRKDIQSAIATDSIFPDDTCVAGQMRYLRKHGNHPVFSGTSITYYSQATQALEDMLEALEKAENFIFMEYFIVDNGEAFQKIREILVRKAQTGVEVRLMYDDFGSIGYVNLEFARELNRQGIQCRVFNPAMPILNLFMNHRDHRKIAVIDGKVAFTGCYNLADEYFDLARPYGHWKDTGIRLEGDAVQSMTTAFLELWCVTARKDENFERYLTIEHSVPAQGLVQPYTDSPLDQEPTAENVYLNIINQARDYVYFMTPYLIITDELGRALGLAAKRGVDVRIITPGIPDKKAVYAVTRSYYAGLVQNGVRIFEYAPGFCHAKQCVCDGIIASIGTSNLDYRSLYHHFENNVLLYDCPVIGDIERDFLDTFSICREVTQAYQNPRSVVMRIWQCILRLFAPMM